MLLVVHILHIRLTGSLLFCFSSKPFLSHGSRSYCDNSQHVSPKCLPLVNMPLNSELLEYWAVHLPVWELLDLSLNWKYLWLTNIYICLTLYVCFAHFRDNYYTLYLATFVWLYKWLFPVPSFFGFFFFSSTVLKDLQMYYTQFIKSQFKNIPNTNKLLFKYLGLAESTFTKSWNKAVFWAL